MGTYVQQVPVKFKSFSVLTFAASVEDTQSYPFPMTVTAIPGASGTILVEYSTTPNAAGNAGAANWTAWPSGTVSAKTVDTLIAPVAALRFTATTATATVEVNA